MRLHKPPLSRFLAYTLANPGYNTAAGKNTEQDREDEPWFMRKLLRKAAKGGPIDIRPGGRGPAADSSDDDDEDEGGEDDCLRELEFTKASQVRTFGAKKLACTRQAPLAVAATAAAATSRGVVVAAAAAVLSYL